MNGKTNEVTVNNIKRFGITDTRVVPLNHVHVGPLSLNVAKMQKVKSEICSQAHIPTFRSLRTSFPHAPHFS